MATGKTVHIFDDNRSYLFLLKLVENQKKKQIKDFKNIFANSSALLLGSPLFRRIKIVF